MSSNELKLKMQSLTDEYEVIKHKIQELCNKMDELSREYNIAESELNSRRVS